MKAWLARFKIYPGSCIAHIAWGTGAGCIGDVNGALLVFGGWAYQFGSGWKKQQRGEIDSVGLDSFDYAIGYLLGRAIKVLLYGDSW